MERPHENQRFKLVIKPNLALIASWNIFEGLKTLNVWFATFMINKINIGWLCDNIFPGDYMQSIIKVWKITVGVTSYNKKFWKSYT